MPVVSSGWTAVEAVGDRLSQARLLQRLHEAFAAGLPVDANVRSVVAQSWRRSGQAGVNPDGHRPRLVMSHDDAGARWELHPLNRVLPSMRDMLSEATTRAGHMLVISDADGVLLWIEGHRRVIEATEDMHLVCGADWSEGGAGTNALGTAIAVDHPVQIFSAEHFSRTVHPWQCSGAPIHDPDTGDILGVIDLTGHLKTAHPHTLSLVIAAAGWAEASLRDARRAQEQRLRELYWTRIAGTTQPTALVGAGGRVLNVLPHGWLRGDVVVPPGAGEVTLADGTVVDAEPLDGGRGHLLWRRTGGAGRSRTRDPGLRLTVCAAQPEVACAGHTGRVSRRQAEILAVLAASPQGMSAEELAQELYGERGKTVTVRAEVSRLRALLGPVLEARPYRLAGPVAADFQEVEALVAAGRVADALSRYPAPLLGRSQVPLVADLRDRVEGGLRAAVLAAGAVDLLVAWCSSPAGRRDVVAARALAAALPDDDPRRRGALERVRRLGGRAPAGDAVATA